MSGAQGGLGNDDAGGNREEAGTGGVGGTAAIGSEGGRAGMPSGSGGVYARGGQGNAGGSSGGFGGSTGGGGGKSNTGGNGGTSGGNAGSSGGGHANGGSGPGTLHITSARAFPAAQMAMVGLRVAVDSQDTAVVLGPTSTSNTGDPGPALTWIPTMGSIRKKSFANEPTPTAMAVDAADAVWLTGRLEQPATFGGTTVPTNSFGYYLVKLNPDGSNAFTKAIVRAEENTVWDGGYSIAFDRDGNAYVAGILVLGDPNFHCTVLVNKFSPSGTLLADRVFHSTSAMQATASDVEVAPNGDLVVVGSFDETLQIGETKLTSASGQYSNGFVAILDASDLSPKQAFSFGGANYYDGAKAIDVTSSGALRVAGILAGASSIGGKSVQAQTGGSAFVAELTATGTANWVRLIQGDVSGLVWQTSTTASDRTFAVGALNGAPSAFFAALDSGGNLTFPVQLSGAGQNGALATTIDRHGGVWVAVEGSGSSQFGNVTPIGASNEQLANWLVHIEP